MDIQNDEFQCPVCLNIPEKEIFQCINGHILCHLCSSNPNLQNCPQCRTILVGQLSRARMLEALLDKLKLDCPHAEVGCTGKFLRKDLSSHEASCKFGKTVEFCKLLGYDNCSFKVPTGILHEIIPSHLQQVHGCTFTQGINRAINWENFYQLDHPERKQPQCHLMELEKNSTVLLLVSKIQGDLASWTFLHMDTNETLPDIRLQISSMEASKAKYEIQAFPVKEAETFLKHPPLIMSLPYLTHLHSMSEEKDHTDLQYFAKIISGVNEAPGDVPVIGNNPTGTELIVKKFKEVLYSQQSDVKQLVEVPLGRPLRTWTTIRIQGKVPEDSYFTIALKTGDAPWADDKFECDVALNITCWIDSKVITRTSYYKGHGWGLSETETAIFPLRHGKAFDILIMCHAVNGFVVKINGAECFQFANRLNISDVKYLQVSKAVVSSIIIDQ